MRWFRRTLLAGLLAVGLLAPTYLNGQPEISRAKEAHPQKPVFTKEIRPLLQTYCFVCHNTTKQKAGLNLEKLDTDRDRLQREMVSYAEFCETVLQLTKIVSESMAHVK